MKRRTLDFIFVVGGVAMAILLAILGLVLKSNANFAEDYVYDELSEQEITFPAKDKLVTNDEWINGKAAADGTRSGGLLATFGGDQAAMNAFIDKYDLTAEADSKCLNKYAGKLVTTGKMAECYANDFIRLHALDGSVFTSQFTTLPEWQTPKPGTYATFGTLRGDLVAVQTQLKATLPAEDPKLEAIQKEIDTVASRRSTQQTAETLRGLLLTTYGFSVFGDKASLAATVCYLVALVLLLASIAGLFHALKTPKTVLVGHHGEPTPTT